MSVTIRPYSKRGKKGWEVDVVLKLPNGDVIRERVKSPVTSKSGTKFWAEQRSLELLRNGAQEAQQKPVPTLKEFEERFMSFADANNKPSSVEAKRVALKNHLMPYFGSTTLDCIGPAETEAFKSKLLKSGLVPKTVNNIVTVLRKALNLAVEWGELKHAPRIRQLNIVESTIEFVTFEEEARFLAAVPAEWHAMIFTALKSGLRVGELLALKWADIDLEAGRINVRRNLWRNIEGSPKGGRSREVPLGDDAIGVLKKHRHLRGPYVFCQVDGKRLSHRQVSRVVQRVCTKAGIAKSLTWHDLRHSYASHLVMRGVTLKAVQELLGHATLDMTLKYAHLSPDVKRDAVKMLDRAAASKLGDILETGVRT